MNGWGEDDRVAARARIVALADRLPGVTVRETHEHTGLLLRGTRFVWLLVGVHGDGRLGLAVKAPPGEQEAFLAADPERWYRPKHLAAKGWVAAHVDAAHAPDWDELEALVERSWRANATRRAVAAHDATRTHAG